MVASFTPAFLLSACHNGDKRVLPLLELTSVLVRLGSRCHSILKKFFHCCSLCVRHLRSPLPYPQDRGSLCNPATLLPSNLAAVIQCIGMRGEDAALLSLQLGEEFAQVHRASPGVLIGDRHFLDKRLEAWVAAHRVPYRLIFVKESDRSRG